MQSLYSLHNKFTPYLGILFSKISWGGIPPDPPRSLNALHWGTVCFAHCVSLFSASTALKFGRTTLRMLPPALSRTSKQLECVMHGMYIIMMKKCAWLNKLNKKPSASHSVLKVSSISIWKKILTTHWLCWQFLDTKRNPWFSSDGLSSCQLTLTPSLISQQKNMEMPIVYHLGTDCEFEPLNLL